MAERLIIPGSEGVAVYQQIPVNPYGVTALDIIGRLNTGAHIIPPKESGEPTEARLLGITRDSDKKGRVRIEVELPDGKAAKVSWKRISLSGPKPRSAAPKNKASESGARKKKRAPRDPNMPRRPVSSFFRYSQEQMPALKQQMPYKEAREKVSAQWSALTDEERAPYVEAAKADMAKHTEAMKQWKAGKEEE